MLPFLSAGALRTHVNLRNQTRAGGLPHELTPARAPSIVYAPMIDDETGVRGHGNFLPTTWRRIQANPGWRARLEKTYTGSARLPRRHDRWRGELECASSSDALLMNVICYPGWLRRPAVAAWLGIEPGTPAEFGVRAALPMLRDEVDRTELDLRLGDLLAEAKLTEGGFGTASWERLRRYRALDEVFDTADLPLTGKGQVAGYQLVRGALAAHATGGRFLLLADARRADLAEMWLRVIRAVHSAELRCRLRLGSWQELAALSPPVLRRFLAEKYGIEAVAGDG